MNNIISVEVTEENQQFVTITAEPVQPEVIKIPVETYVMNIKRENDSLLSQIAELQKKIDANNETLDKLVKKEVDVESILTSNKAEEPLTIK